MLGMGLLEIKQAMLRKFKDHPEGQWPMGEDQAFMIGVEAGMRLGYTEGAINYVITEFPLEVDSDQNILIRTRLRLLPEGLDKFSEWSISQEELVRYGVDVVPMVLREYQRNAMRLVNSMDHPERATAMREALGRFNIEGPKS